MILLSRLRTDFEDIQRKEDISNEGTLKVAAVMFRKVFVEIKKNIPFDSHESLVNLQEMNWVKMGFHHYEKCGAISISESISAFIHLQLMNYTYGIEKSSFL